MPHKKSEKKLCKKSEIRKHHGNHDHDHSGKLLPFLINVTPNGGPSIGGSAVTINGYNLDAVTQVNFGSNPASNVQIVNKYRLTAATPSGSGIVSVKVVNQYGESNALFFKYDDDPYLSLISPGTGPSNGGNSVSLYGDGFLRVTSVKFGNNATAVFTVINDNVLNVTVPTNDGQSGQVEVRVMTTSGPTTSNSVTYTYISVPVIESLTPDQGPTVGNRHITITGSGLTTAQAVKFGATYGVVVSIINDNTITVRSPPGTGSVNVSVMTAGGWSNELAYVYVPPPQI